MLLGIAVSTICCIVGISFLLEKNREKLSAVAVTSCAAGSDTEDVTDADHHVRANSVGRGFESLNRKGSEVTETGTSINE